MDSFNCFFSNTHSTRRRPPRRLRQKTKPSTGRTRAFNRESSSPLAFEDSAAKSAFVNGRGTYHAAPEALGRRQTRDCPRPPAISPTCGEKQSKKSIHSKPRTFIADEQHPRGGSSHPKSSSFISSPNRPRHDVKRPKRLAATLTQQSKTYCDIARRGLGAQAWRTGRGPITGVIPLPCRGKSRDSRAPPSEARKSHGKCSGTINGRPKRRPLGEFIERMEAVCGVDPLPGGGGNYSLPSGLADSNVCTGETRRASEARGARTSLQTVIRSRNDKKPHADCFPAKNACRRRSDERIQVIPKTERSPKAFAPSPPRRLSKT